MVSLKGKILKVCFFSFVFGFLAFLPQHFAKGFSDVDSCDAALEDVIVGVCNDNGGSLPAGLTACATIVDIGTCDYNNFTDPQDVGICSSCYALLCSGPDAPNSCNNSGIPFDAEGVTLREIQIIIETIARWMIAISVIIAIIFILYGGIIWASARGNPEQLKSAKSTLRNGIIGALIVLGIGVIMQTLAGVVTRTFFG